MNDHPKPYMMSNGSRTVDYTPAGVRARIADFCRQFAEEAPALTVRGGKVHMTDELLVWCNKVGASLDWIIFGDARCLAVAYREQNAPPVIGPTQLMAMLAIYDADEKRHLLACLEAHKAGEVTIEEATARFRECVDANRAEV